VHPLRHDWPRASSWRTLKAAEYTLNSRRLIHECTRSVDGTRIGITRIGSGPPLVFVHGSLSQGSNWLLVARHLAHDYTCYLMDRRGHGVSDFGDHRYSIDREYDDVLAVLSRAGDNATLIGHSFGAICCLGAATLTNLPHLVLYEPPLPLHGLIAGRNLAPYCHAMRDGRFDDALEIGLREFIRLPHDHVESIRATTAWSRLASLMSAWPRELEAMDSLGDNVEAYAAIGCPTLLVSGSRSPKHPFRNAVAALCRSLPHACAVDIAGHGHLGLRSAPAVVAQEISRFLSGWSPPASGLNQARTA